jgi:hypothetical protein
MKPLLTSLFLLCFCSLFSQSEFYDAKTLAAYVSPANKKFAAEGTQVDTIRAIFAKYKYALSGNPFLDTFLTAGQTFGTGSTRPLATRIEAAASFVGNLDVTNLADGIARFLIKRGKEELNVAFFNRMKEFLEDPEYPECKTLFPVTSEFLGNVATYRYAELINTLREAFYKDLSNLIVGVNQLIDLPKYRELLKDFPEIRAAVRCSRIVSELSQSEAGILPDSLIHQLAEIPEFQEIHSNLGNSLKLLDIFSRSIREQLNPAVPQNMPQRRWIKLSDMNSLVTDDIQLRLFIGLVYQRIKEKDIQFHIKGQGSVRVTAFLDAHSGSIFVASGLIENFALLANDVDRAIRDIEEKRAAGSLSDEDYYTYINKAINITEYGFKVANTIKENVIDDEYIVMARNANELYKNIYSKNYNNAIMNVYNILDQAFNKDELINNKTGIAIGKTRFKDWGPSVELIEKILRYGNFMASVVKAESGEEVQSALEAAALPAGSYSIKQKSAFNVSLNGYIGYALDLNSGIYARGVYAPVGLSVSRGSARKWAPAFTLFGSVIDVGALATYRLANGPTEELRQEVRLESIFSPSLQLFIEPIRGFPLALGAGWRRTPKMFYSDNTSFIAVPSLDVINVSFLIDIPIFTIVNKNFFKK